MTKISLELDDESIQILTKLAASNDRSLSAQARVIIKSFEA